MVGSRNGAANRSPSAAPPRERAARRLPSSATPAVSISLSFGRRSDVSGVVYTPKWDVQVSKPRTTASLGRSRAGQSGLQAKSNGAVIISTQAAVRSGRSCMTARSLQPMQSLHGLICKRPGVATMSKWAATLRDTSWPNMTAWTATPTGKGDGHLRRKHGAVQKQGRAVRSTMTVKRSSLLKRKSFAGQQALIARQATITGKFFGHQPKRTGVVAPTAVDVLPTTPTTATLTSCRAGQNPR